MPRRKTKEAKPQEVTPPTEVKQEEPEAKEAKVEEVKVEEPKVESVKPVEEAKPEVKIKTITWEEFERFEKSRSEKKSWVKEAVERAKTGPVMIEGLTRGQIAALINYVDKYNSESFNTPKIAYKYDVKKGVVLLAPVVKK